MSLSLITRVLRRSMPPRPGQGALPAEASARLGARLLLPALVGTSALAVALLAQGYLNRRLLIGDSVYLFLWAIALFVVAFPRAQPRPVVGGAAGILVRAGALLLAVLVLVKALQDFASGRDLVVATVLVCVPLMLIGAAFAEARASSRPEDEPDEFEHHLWQRNKPGSRQRLLDLLCFGISIALVVVAVVYWLAFKQAKANDAFFLYTLSVAVLMLGVYRLDRGVSQAKPRMATDAPPRWLEGILLLAVVGVAAFLRSWQLESIPYGVWFDEAQAGQEALRFAEGRLPFTPMGTYSANNPSPFFYLVAVAFKALGPSLLVLRVVQALIGVATVPLLYILLRYLLGWREALIGALMLGVSAWHVNFSRYGMCCNIEAPPFEILTLFFLVKGFRTGRLTDFAWGGLMMGAGQFTYAAFRLFPAIIAGYAAYGIFLNKERVRRSIAGLVLYMVVALVVFAPLGVWAWEHRQEFMMRTNQTSVFAGKNTPDERQAALNNSLRRHIQMLNLQGDGNGRHGLPGAPAVDFIAGALFVIGLGYALYRWQTPAYPLLVLWFAVMMLSGILSLDWEAPQQARTVVAIPAIYALAAIPFARLWRAWDSVARALRSARARRVAIAGVWTLALAAAALLSYVNYDRYFNRQMQHPEAFYAFSTIETVVARRVAELGPTANRYFVQNQDTPGFQFLVGGETPARPVDATFFRAYAHMPLRQPITKTAVYLLEPWRVTLEPKDVLRYYPNAQFVDHKDPFGKTMVFEFRVPPSDVSELLGLRGRYYAGDQPQGQPLLDRTDQTLAFDWRAQPPVSAPFNVEWTGAIIPAEAGVHVFDVATDGEVRMALDGQWLDIAPGRTQARVDLAKGQHPVVIQLRGQSINLSWTQPNGQKQTIPATSLLAKGWPENGLVARYYRGETWQGRPEFVQVDPYLAFRWHPDPIEPGPWSATWTGQLQIDQPGRYMFQGVSNDRFWLIIDGKTLLNGNRGLSEVQLDLTSGRHDIQIKYANNRGYSELRLSWRTPDNRFEVVPNSVLFAP